MKPLILTTFLLLASYALQAQVEPQATNDSIVPDVKAVEVNAPKVVPYRPVVHIAKDAHITIYNRTSFDLDSVYFDHKYIGYLPKDSSTSFLISGKIRMQEGTPLGPAKAKPLGVSKEQTTYASCGSGRHTMKTGKYEFDIVYIESEDDYYLDWWKHKDYPEGVLPTAK